MCLRVRINLISTSKQIHRNKPLYYTRRLQRLIQTQMTMPADFGFLIWISKQKLEIQEILEKQKTETTKKTQNKPRKTP